MIRRFQIEDIIVQDTSGVVFRALDTESGNIVAVRRFFPFGVDGGGLHADEQTAYNIAVSRLAGLSHPALRSIICGGCDPVDGMPFIATEWVEGVSLLPYVERGPLTPESATELLTQALEVCELLSHVLAEEAVWVETELQTIEVGNEGSGRRFTFWISPLKWLGSGDEPRGLQAIVKLTEQLMGWQGQKVNDHAGHGLGGWLNWLRHNADSTTLTVARETLAASIGAEPPPPTQRLVAQAVRPAVPARRVVAKVRRSKPKAMFFVNIGLVLLILGLGAWLYVRQASGNGNLKPPAFLTSLVKKPATETIVAVVPDHVPEVPAGMVFLPENPDSLLKYVGKEVVVEATLQNFETSDGGKGKWLYLLFSNNNNRLMTRGKIIKDEAPPNLSEAALKALQWKKIRIRGEVESQKLGDDTRPLIRIKERAQIIEVP